MALSRAKRWQVQYPVQLFTEDLFVEGRTVDMSLHGLRVATERSIREGTSVVVRVLAPERGCSVDCMLYTVRWIDKGRIGLEASELSATEQRRLQDRLASLDQDQEPVVESTSPCITIEQPITSITDTVAVLWQLMFPGHHVINGSNRSLHSLQGSKQHPPSLSRSRHEKVSVGAKSVKKNDQLTGQSAESNAARKSAVNC